MMTGPNLARKEVKNYYKLQVELKVFTNEILIAKSGFSHQKNCIFMTGTSCVRSLRTLNKSPPTGAQMTCDRGSCTVCEVQLLLVHLVWTKDSGEAMEYSVT